MEVEPTLILDKIKRALEAGRPFVAYNLPDEEILHGWFQKDTELYFTNDLSESGFVFGPFDDSKKTILFPEDACDRLTAIFKSKGETEDISDSNWYNSESTADRANHIKLVKQGIDFLNNTTAQKVVLSRKKMIDVKDIDVPAVFKKLLDSYSSAMVYCWFHPEIGIWMGASPETLLLVSDDDFTTMALAGTQVYQGSTEVDWRDKEKLEQQFVTDFIVEQLPGELTVSKPFTVRAGNVLHLCTLIQGKITPYTSLKLLLEKLHPTPAVCGLPQEAAKQFILTHEHYAREFYTGFLGELHLDTASKLFVNLRCMQIFPDKVTLYIGGGITQDSDPENEWQETVAKSKVMLRALK